MNKYIDTQEPWTLAKDEDRSHELATVLYQLMEGLRTVAGLIFPVMPGTSARILNALGMPLPESGFFSLEEIRPWGQVPTGADLSKPEILFPRIEVKKETKAKAPGPRTFKPALKEEITIEDFSKIDLRAGKILAAERIENSSKLLKLQVDLGAETRQIIAGIAKTYSPEDVLGKEVIVVANLKEAKLMGEISQGMILAASRKKDLVLSGFDDTILPGNPVK
jgi:methionyl-tRNA synthetase